MPATEIGQPKVLHHLGGYGVVGCVVFLPELARVLVMEVDTRLLASPVALRATRRAKGEGEAASLQCSTAPGVILLHLLPTKVPLH